jgi:hypothetical protein
VKIRKAVLEYGDRKWRFDDVDTDDISDGILFVRLVEVVDERIMK